MTNFERCSESKHFLATIINDMSQIGPETAGLVDWEKWLESEEKDPTFKSATPGKYTPGAKRRRWYKCLILDEKRTLFGKPAALIWTLAADHVAIIVPRECVRYE